MDKKTATVIAKNAESPPDQLESIVGIDQSVDRSIAKHPNASVMLLEKLIVYADIQPMAGLTQLIMKQITTTTSSGSPFI